MAEQFLSIFNEVTPWGWVLQDQELIISFWFFLIFNIYFSTIFMTFPKVFLILFCQNIFKKCSDFLTNLCYYIHFLGRNLHCVKSVQIRIFFWSIFSRIRIEYGEIRSIFPYSVKMRENTGQKNLRIWTHFTQCYYILKKLEQKQEIVKK